MNEIINLFRPNRLAFQENHGLPEFCEVGNAEQQEDCASDHEAYIMSLDDRINLLNTVLASNPSNQRAIDLKATITEESDHYKYMMQSFMVIFSGFDQLDLQTAEGQQGIRRLLDLSRVTLTTFFPTAQKYPFQAERFAELKGQVLDRFKRIEPVIKEPSFKAEVGRFIEQMGEKAESIYDIPDITPERVSQAGIALENAYTYIKTTLAPVLKSQATAGSPDLKDGLQRVEALIAEPLNVNYYLPLMIKESKLDASATSRSNARGLFQILPIVQKEIKMYYGLDISDADINDPTKNAILGILYLHRCRDKYAKESQYDGLSDADREMLVHAMYNAGPTSMRNLWRELTPSSYVDFEDKMSQAIALQLDSSFDASHSALLENIKDPTYNITYNQPIGVQYYLQFLVSDPTKLDANLVVDGKTLDITIRKAGEILRYTRMIEAIDGLVGEREAAPIAPPQAPPSPPQAPPKGPDQGSDIIPSHNPEFIEYHIKPGDSLWQLGRQHGVSADYLIRVSPDITGPESLQVGDVVRLPKVPDEVSQYLHTELFGNGVGWITVTPGKGFWSTVVGNEAYSLYLDKELDFSEASTITSDYTKEDVLEVIIAFNRRYNPELKDLADDTGNIPKGAQIWVPNADFFMDYFRGEVGERTPVILPPPIDEPPSGPGPRPPVAPPPMIGITNYPPLPESMNIPEQLDQTTRGQYVKRNQDGRWVRDIGLMNAGREIFTTQEWDTHPTWVDRTAPKETRKKGKQFVPQYIVLHSTASSNCDDAIQKRAAHFGVEKDGTIKYIVPVEKSENDTHMFAHHAGRGNMWDGYDGLDEHSIGIEVAAQGGEAWTNEQYIAIKQLVEWLGGYYALPKSSVIMHKQVGYHLKNKWDKQNKRGRKEDPYENGSVVFSRLGLPDNSRLLDLDTVSGRLRKHSANDIADIRRDCYGLWDGVVASNDLQGTLPSSSSVELNPQALADWKMEIERQFRIADYTIQAGDTFARLERAFGCPVQVMQIYNNINDPSTLRVGQVIKIPVPKQAP